MREILLWVAIAALIALVVKEILQRGLIPATSYLPKSIPWESVAKKAKHAYLWPMWVLAFLVSICIFVIATPWVLKWTGKAVRAAVSEESGTAARFLPLAEGSAAYQTTGSNAKTISPPSSWQGKAMSAGGRFTDGERRHVADWWQADPLHGTDPWTESATQARSSIELRDASEKFLLNFGFMQGYTARRTLGSPHFSTLVFNTGIDKGFEYLRPHLPNVSLRDTSANVGWITPAEGWQRDPVDPVTGYYFELHAPPPREAVVLRTERTVAEGTTAPWGRVGTHAPNGRPLAVEMQLIILHQDAQGVLRRAPHALFDKAPPLFALTAATDLERVPKKDTFLIQEEVTPLPPEFLQSAGDGKRLLIRIAEGFGRAYVFVNVRITPLNSGLL